MHYEITKGEALSIEGIARDRRGCPVDVSSGYKFTASIKLDIDDTDAAAFVHIDSDEADQFATNGSSVVTDILLSAKSETGTLATYQYDIWAKATSGGKAIPIDRGTIEFIQSVSITKT